MYDYIQSAISESDDNVVVQIDPAAVEGKYLEVVSSKPISAGLSCCNEFLLQYKLVIVCIRDEY